LAALVALTMLAASCMLGCGGGTVTVTAAAPPGGAEAASTRSVATAATRARTTAPATRVVHLDMFRSPSGNIGCSLLGGLARCDIEKRSWRPPARPSSCPQIVDFGQGLEVGGSGAARFVCAGDTARDPASPVLPYGSGSQVGALDCLSASSGLTCRNGAGHGFFISIQGYRIF
jgi:hypothetical protein